MAQEGKHTAGPWYPGHLGSDGTCQCANVVDEGYAGGICTIHIGNGKPIGEGGNDAPPREQAIANMHLIAAAPDLLEVAKMVIEDAAKYRGQIAPVTLRIVESAIAKAEGHSDA